MPRAATFRPQESFDIIQRVMYKHVTKKRKTEEPVDSDASSGSSDEEEFRGFGDSKEVADDSDGDSDDIGIDEAVFQSGSEGGDGSSSGEDPLEKPLVGDPPNQKCILCPMKTFRGHADALTHMESNPHARRRERVERFLATEEAEPFIENNDVAGIVALLDDRARNKPAAGQGKEKKKRKRSQMGARDRKKQKEARQTSTAKTNGLNGSREAESGSS